jgi:hypothetical protein
MSRYNKPQQRSLDSVEVGLSGFGYKPKGFPKQFREACDSIIPDKVFDGLYSDRGREARSPSLLTRLVLLQLRGGRSDEQIVEDLYCDVRVRYMCDFGFDQKRIHPTNLVYHRLRLLYGTIYRDRIAALKEAGFEESESPVQDVFDKIKEAAIGLGIMDAESAQLIDSTAILGRAAVMDSYRLIWNGIRATLKRCNDGAGEGTEDLILRLRRQDYLEDMAKPKIDWESAPARAELLTDLVSDATEILGAGLSMEDKELEGLLIQLAKLLAQDVVTEGDGTAKLKEGVTQDRQVSTVDTDMRHGRKSKSKRFNGYKGTITADPESGVITGVHVMGGNEHDSVAVAPMIEQQIESGACPPALIGDRAYATEDARHEAMKLGVAMVTKPNTTSSQVEGFGKANFSIDMMGRIIICPNGVTRSIVGNSITFSGKHCASCSHSEVCLGKSGKRTIKIREHEALQRDAEVFALTQRGKELLALRPGIERVIAYWVRNGVRQARYFGRPKVWLQAMLSAIVCNLGKIGRYVDKRNDNQPKTHLYAAYSDLITALRVVLSIISDHEPFVKDFTRKRGTGQSLLQTVLKKPFCSVAS